MSREDFIIHVYYVVDQFLKNITKNKKIRSRGPAPALSDAEIITMQIVGEFLGMDGDKNIWQYFKLNWTHLFPKIGDRSTFVKQVGNLHYWIIRLQESMAKSLGAFDDNIHITDGFPMPVCHFKRANSSKSFYDEATYGYCAAKDEIFYGFKGHALISFDGVITHFAFASANVDERDVLPENSQGITGVLLGDKGYIRPSLSEILKKRELQLEHPVRANMKETRSEDYLERMKNIRRRIETVISQLSEQFNIEKVRARKSWRLAIRFTRKILSHTMGVFLNRFLGRPDLKLADLVG